MLIYKNTDLIDNLNFCIQRFLLRASRMNVIKTFNFATTFPASYSRIQNIVNNLIMASSGDNIEVSTFRDHPIHEAVTPIIWLHGRWRTESGQGIYTNIIPFTYAEEIQFSSYGQPGLNYSSVSWNPEKKMPMHLESGFLRIKPETNDLAFMVAHNFGLVTMEEGKVMDQTIELNCNQVLRMAFSNGPKVTKTKRTFTLKADGLLEQVLFMETSNTPMSEHLRVIYHKID